MADLLPSIDSDEEFKPPEDVPEDEDDEDEKKDGAMNKSFEFGGILVSLNYVCW